MATAETHKQAPIRVRLPKAASSLCLMRTGQKGEGGCAHWRMYALSMRKKCGNRRQELLQLILVMRHSPNDSGLLFVQLVVALPVASIMEHPFDKSLHD